MKNIIEMIENQLQSNKTDLMLKDYKIEELQRKLAAAEKEIEELKAGKFETRCAE